VIVLTSAAPAIVVDLVIISTSALSQQHQAVSAILVVQLRRALIHPRRSLAGCFFSSQPRPLAPWW